MRTVKMDPGAVVAAAGAVPEGVPIVMLNMLRFREQADYGNRAGITPCSGREAYFQRYAPTLRGLIERGEITGVDSRIVWVGSAHASVIAPVDEPWDSIALVEYPSFAAFRRLVESPRYLAEASFHRTAALEDSRLIATTKLTM